MAQVSKWKLRSDSRDLIYNLFLETVNGIRDKNKLRIFLDEFLSDTERIMLTKRLASLVLLSRGYDYNTIKEKLHISTGTIANMSVLLKYAGEGLKPVIRDIEKREAGKVVWEEIKSVLDLPTKGSLKSSDRFKKIRERHRKVRKIIELT